MYVYICMHVCRYLSVHECSYTNMFMYLNDLWNLWDQ